jgi:hypothetical protein
MEIIIAIAIVVLGAAFYFNRKPKAAVTLEEAPYKLEETAVPATVEEAKEEVKEEVSAPVKKPRKPKGPTVKPTVKKPRAPRKPKAK